MTIEGAKTYLIDLRDNVLPLSHPAFEAVTMAISVLEKQEQSCDTCRHKSESFNGKRCGDCSVGYPDRYEAETNFEATSKNFEPYKTEKEPGTDICVPTKTADPYKAEEDNG